MKDKAVVVFSGGQDSTTCLFWALKKFDEVIAVTFDYGQRNKKEIECAKAIADELDIEHHVLDMGLLNQLAPNALTREDIKIEMGENGALPSTFVEGRNMIFLTFAGVLAKVKGAKHIVTGVCETDFSGYPDCRDIFIKSLNVTLNLAMDYTFVLHTPLMWINKAQTWEMADQLGKLDYVREKTLTCYNGIMGDGCGECPACHLRQRGLNEYLESKKEKKMQYTGRTKEEMKEVTLLGNQGTKYEYGYNPEILEVFDNKHPNNDYWVKFNCPEFTSLCPITGQPDFATIYISYIPGEKMVESKSLKLYLFSFRNHGDFHEDCMNIIMKDLIKLMDPKYIEVWGKFTPRGGISIDPYCNYGKPDTKFEQMAEYRMMNHDLYPEKVDNR